MEDVECVVIGAGVVGLATARALALRGHEVLLLDREADFGTGISSRNSEVIHAGIYYPAGSLKAALCVRGRDMLYEYCRHRAVPCQRIGKLIVGAGAADTDRLKAIMAGAHANGVHDLRLLLPADVMALEPALGERPALLSPSTGIVDSHAYMLALLGDTENAQGTFARRAEVLSATPATGGTILETGGDAAMRLRAKWVVNAAGLQAQALARAFAALPSALVPPSFYAKGSYFSYAGKVPFARLIYPLPEPGGLGVHLTLDMAGDARFGPDVEWCDEADYEVDEGRRAHFAAAIRRYWPDVDEGRLNPAFAGVRPKTIAPGGGEQDFAILGPRDHGMAGQVHLFGIESPGLTASLAIAERVVGILEAAPA